MKEKCENILSRYKYMSKEVKAAFWYTLCNILLKALSMITVPIFTRVLSETDYGIVSVFTGWEDIFFILGTLNLYHSAYNTAIIKYKDKLDSFTSSMLGLIFSIVTIIATILMCGNGYISSVIGLPPKIIVVMLVELYVVPAYYFWMTKERFYYNYRKVVIVTLLVSITSPCISLLLILNAKSDQSFLKIIGTSIPTILVGTVLTIMFFKKGKCFFNKEYWKYGLKFNIPLIPHYLSGSILNQSDRLMISKLISMDKAGIYSVAYSASFTISVLTTAINNSIVPWIYNCMTAKNYRAIGKRTNQIIVVFAFVLLAFILIIPEVIKVFAPPPYYEAISILPVLIMSVFFQFLYGFFGTVDFYYENSIYPMLASVVAAIINLIANYLFIPMYGYLAAAYTTLFSYVIMAIMHYVLMRAVMKTKGIKDRIFDIRTIVIISILFVFLGSVESLLYGKVIIRYLLATVFFILLFINKNYLINVLKKEEKD